MEKNSTLFTNLPFTDDKKKLKEKVSADNQPCPGDMVIANILAFSKALEVEKSHEGTPIERTLN